MQETTKGQKLVKIPNRDHYYFDKNSKRIYFVRKVQDEIIKFSTGILWDETPSCLIKASRIVSVKEKEKKDIKRSVVIQKLIGEHIEDLVEKIRKSGKSKGTIKSYETTSKKLKPFFESYLPEELTDELWVKFTEVFQKENPGFVMFNVTKHFKVLCRSLHKEGILRRMPYIYNPKERLEEANRKKKKHRSFTAQEIQRMDDVCTPDQRLVLWLGYDMAFRLDDCVKLTWDRINFETREIVFFGDENKTDFSGRVPLSDTCYDLLLARSEMSEGKWVFPLESDPNLPMRPQQLRFEEVVRNSEIGYGSQHILRHTRLTEDFGNPDLPDTLVMKIRRVSLKVALEHYIHPTDSDLEKFRNTGKAKRSDRRPSGARA